MAHERIEHNRRLKAQRGDVWPKDGPLDPVPPTADARDVAAADPTPVATVEPVGDAGASRAVVREPDGKVAAYGAGPSLATPAPAQPQSAVSLLRRGINNRADAMKRYGEILAKEHATEDDAADLRVAMDLLGKSIAQVEADRKVVQRALDLKEMTSDLPALQREAMAADQRARDFASGEYRAELAKLNERLRLLNVATDAIRGRARGLNDRARELSDLRDLHPELLAAIV